MSDVGLLHIHPVDPSRTVEGGLSERTLSLLSNRGSILEVVAGGVSMSPDTDPPLLRRPSAAPAVG
jgi:hypothetical protein